MIPIIGLIIGIYCVVRLLGMTSQIERPITIRILALLGAIAVAYLSYALIHVQTPPTTTP